MDLSIEKTNSAYMLFYEKVDTNVNVSAGDEDAMAGPSSMAETDGSGSLGSNVAAAASTTAAILNRETDDRTCFQLSPDLEEWIWQDNKNFIQDNNIFDHTYFRLASLK